MRWQGGHWKKSFGQGQKGNQNFSHVLKGEVNLQMGHFSGKQGRRACERLLEGIAQRTFW